ncbi:hypothetical protein CONCODRAFT_76858 [Conidiobolus coronatus NRRL 28638]|uniref:Helix-turn-helix type 11 domain-containing protein n=1 Tax=Conidiobolus coronatus (strain ATCC 28846 / CBS 209.66 / NRRL 28638) TaxID=796925 RepID=A0A137PHJ9_CONC2|nr:hypothetical protein CONCODRAFT_76858 [Conidiobolus coronatus NRRL 28638]|eukprot:KXN74477.1 hypothetical protein CONCODRAFT_76858 [Conidiobolus coronatus NRRL 28638]
MRTIHKWYNIFRSEEDISDKKPVIKHHKITDEFLIKLINENPELNMAELGKLAGTNASVISIRLKEINSDGERVKYKSKVAGRPKTFSDEALIKLSNDNPNSTIAELSSLVGASFSVVARRIKQINSSEEKIKCKSKRTGKKARFTDEYLISMINENPDLSMTKLGSLLGVSASTISFRLNRMKCKGENTKYIYKNCKNGTADENKAKTRISNQRIIDLINKNPELNMVELAKLAGISSSTISRRIKIIKNSGQQIDHKIKNPGDDEPKLGGRPRKFTDEFLIRLFDENPDLNLAELAKIADTSVKTLLGNIKKVNCDSVRINYTSKKEAPKFSDEFLINVINDNPDLNIGELSKLIGYSTKVISNRIKKMKCNGKVVNYVNKKPVPKSKVKLTEEYLINLINENPGLTMAELANLADVTPSTVSCRIRKINCNGIRVNYIYKNNQKIEEQSH